MNHDTAQLSEVLREFCLNHISATEDLSRAEKVILDDLFALLSVAMGKALCDFDDVLAKGVDSNWRIKDKRARTLLTEFGDVSFARRIYIDECADRRCLLDEIVAIRPYRRLSPGAFEALCYFGAEVPYGRAAKTCFRHCKTKVSATVVMNTLREVGGLLEDEASTARDELFKDGVIPKAKGQASTVCLEADGIWVALQKSAKKSAEIKAMCAYAGKKDNSRIACMHHAAISTTPRFFEEGIARMGAHFALDKIAHIYTASDGGAWDKKAKDYLPFTEVTHKLDPWHLNRAIKTAWPDRCDSAPLFDFLNRGDLEGLLSLLRLRLDAGLGDTVRIKALITYIENNYDSIVSSAPSMGTMEGTNAHLYAARMKAFGGAWSYQGASDMARIRSYVFSGDEVPMPCRSQTFTAKDVSRRQRAWLAIQQRSGTASCSVVQSEGEGYEPPQGHLMPLSSAETKTWLRFVL